MTPRSYLASLVPALTVGGARLRSRLLLIAVAAMLPAVLAVGYAQSTERRAARDRTLADSLRLARLAASRQAAVLDGARRLLLTLAKFPDLMGPDRAGCRDLMVKVLSDHAGYFNLSVADPDGSLFCAAVPSDADLLQQSERARLFARAIATGGPTMTSYERSADRKSALLIAHPVLDGTAHVRRVLAVSIAAEELTAVLAPAELPAGATLLLSDRGGRVLMRVPDGAAWADAYVPVHAPIDGVGAAATPDRVVEGIGGDGGRRLYATVPVHGSIDSGLYLTMGIDPAAAFAEADRVFHAYVLLLALVVLGAVVSASAAHMFVLRPVAALKAVAGRLAQGDLTARAQLATAVGGITDLGEAFNTMAVALDQRHRELRDSEDRYRLLFAENPHAMWLFDRSTLQFLEVNQAALRRYGYTRAEFLSMRVTDIRPAEDVERLTSLLTSERPAWWHSGPWRHRLKSGAIINVDIVSHAVNFGGRPAQLVTAQDVTAQTEAEGARVDSEERFRLISHTVTQVFWISNIATEAITYVSPAYEKIWGRPAESVYEAPQTFLESIHPDDRDGVRDTLRVQHAGRPFDHEYRIVRPDGGIRWIRDRGFPVHSESGTAVQYVGIAEDVTARRGADERLRMLALALESTNEMVSVTGVDDRFTFVNSAFLRTYGYAREEIIGRTPDLLRSEQVPEHMSEAILRQARAGRWTGDVVSRRKDGTEFFINLNTSAIRDDRGDTVGLLSVARDITERLAAERTLRDTEERMRFALDAARVGVWEAHYKTGKAFWSATCEAMHGLTPGTFGGTREAFIACVHPDDRQSVIESLDQAARRHEVAEFEYRALWPDATVHTIGCVGHFAHDPDGVPIRGAGIIVDVTERRSLEDQLRQSQKMEAIGQLAGGIAHDFNNLLTAIKGFASFLADSLEGDTDRLADIEQIQGAADRAAALTRQLLAFSRKQILSVKVMHVGDVTTELAPMLRRLLGEAIDLQTTVADRGLVKADPSQLQQVIVNLAVNARDAMNGRGKLTIETTDVTLDDAFVRRHPGIAAGRHVMIAVSDTGHGMDAETLKHIFEPFFTTKPKDSGTGLGLATVYGIVKQSGGSIWVYSEVGRGTSFKLYLPVTLDREDAAAQSAQPKQAPRGSEAVLLVEDEELVREFVSKILTRHGYTVHALADPKDAIAYAEAHGAAIDLVFTDVVLPDMSGPAMAGLLKQSHPEAKILYMSGYADQAIVRQGVLDPGTPFLQKPFTSDTLARKVREVLDAAVIPA